jgi:excinuclease ABC subunit B
MRFEEWEAASPRTVYVSATPGPYELGKSQGVVVEQLIRPTGLLDPTIEVRPTKDQVPDLMKEAAGRVSKKERLLVTTLTKRMAEDLSGYLKERGIKVHYLHSDQDAIERVEILRSLRAGAFDVLVGINLLREGLDLPEVSLVAILDADKEGFLRSETALVQTIGRTARNVNAHVILYADQVTPSMRRAMDETARRRETQSAYNKAHAITPETVKKALRETIEAGRAHRLEAEAVAGTVAEKAGDDYAVNEAVFQMEAEMREAAIALDFEAAAAIRDRILTLKPAWRGAELAPAVAATRKKGRGRPRG